MKLKMIFILFIMCFVISFLPFSAKAEITSVGGVEPFVSSTGNADIRDTEYFFFIGVTDDGSVIIDEGSKLESLSAFLGFERNYKGSVIITGVNSQWDIYPQSPENPGLLTVGWRGVGDLLIDENGLLNTIAPYLDCFSLIGYEGAGTVTLTNNSKWIDEGTIGLGHSGNGMMDVDTDSQVISNDINIGIFPGAIGTLNINGGGSVKSNYAIWLAQIENTLSTVTVSGLNSILEAGTQIRMAQWPPDTGGGVATLIIKDGALISAPHIYLGSSSIIAGNSKVEGMLHNGGGTLSPGISIGTLTIAGAYNTDNSGPNEPILLIEINSSGNDFLDVIGDPGVATIGGILDVRLLDEFRPTVGQEYLILKAEFLSGEFDINKSNLPKFSGRTFDIIYNENEVLLRVIALSEPAIVDIMPDTLNLKSKGNFVTCYIELPEGYNAGDIDPETATLTIGETTIEAELSPTQIGDYNDNSIPDLMVKFDRQSVQDACDPGAVEITVCCETYDGSSFEGTDTVLVIDKGKEHFSDDKRSVVY